MLMVTDPLSGCADTRSVRPSSRRSGLTPPRRGRGETFTFEVCADAMWLSRPPASASAVGAHPPRVGDQLLEATDAYLVQPHHDQRPAVVPAGGEELVRLPADQRLLLRLIADIENGDVPADDARLARLSFRIGPDETLVLHPEVEAVTVDLHDAAQRQRTSSYVVRIRHESSSSHQLEREFHCSASS